MSSRTIRWVAAAVAVVLLGAAPAWAEVVVKRPQRGTFKMRPELRGRHPRLYFTAEDVPELRRRAEGEGRFYADAAKRAFRSYLGGDIPAEMPEWKRYVYGLWALSTFDILWHIEGDEAYRDTAKAWALTHARDRWWVEDNLTHMDTMSGLAITYDMLYDEFSEPERKLIRDALYEGLEMIYGEFFEGQYWTNDFQNNHLHNRLHAMAHAAVAIYGDDPKYDVAKHADLAVACVRDMIKWLPPDGSNHEGPGYWSFGHHWAERVVTLAEHVTGEDLAGRNPHFGNAHWFRIYMSAPGWGHTMNIGDAGEGAPSNLTALVPSIAHGADPQGKSALEMLQKRIGGQFYQHPIWGLFWMDPELEAQPLDEMPLWRFWPDLEMFSIRSSWDDDATCFVFKCGPVGGHHMQKLRDGEYVNVAHDHPDQNHFLLFAGGRMMAQDDGYPKEKKLTRSHNTITVDGEGQPREGTGWQQPFPYSQTGTMDEVFLTHNSAYAVGDASACYEEADRFVRHAAFVCGEYVILMDELAGRGRRPHDFQWRLHKDGQWEKLDDGRFSVADGPVTLDVNFLAPKPGGMTSEFLPAELTAKPCLAVTQSGAKAGFLSVIDPRGPGEEPRNAKGISGKGCVAVQVTSTETTDTFCVAGKPAGFEAGAVSGHGTAALVRMVGEQPTFAMVTRGTRVAAGDETLLRASRPCNMSRRVADDGAVIVEAEAPYKSKLGGTRLSIGGLEPDTEYPLWIAGEKADAVTSNGSGAVAVSVNLDRRQAIQVGGRKCLVPYAARTDYQRGW